MLAKMIMYFVSSPPVRNHNLLHFFSESRTPIDLCFRVHVYVWWSNQICSIIFFFSTRLCGHQWIGFVKIVLDLLFSILFFCTSDFWGVSVWLSHSQRRTSANSFEKWLQNVVSLFYRYENWFAESVEKWVPREKENIKEY